jgi:hypothetical protein
VVSHEPETTGTEDQANESSAPTKTDAE